MTELFKLEDVFTSVNADEAKEYIGKKVYLADSLAGLKGDASTGAPWVLDDILDETNTFRFQSHNGYSKALMIPADKVTIPMVEPVIEYRPFTTVSEFEIYTGLNLGDKVEVRGKDWQGEDHMELTYIGNGVRDGRHRISLGNVCLEVSEWFEYEYYSNAKEKWVPFGI